MKRWEIALLGSALLVIAVSCATEPPAAPTPVSTTEPKPEEIWSNPESFFGQEVVIEGILEAEGQGLDARFFLRGPGDARLEVTAWAPLEVMHPPGGEGPRPKIMLDYVGQKVQLAGVVAQSGDGYILKVSLAQIVP